MPADLSAWTQAGAVHRASPQGGPGRSTRPTVDIPAPEDLTEFTHAYIPFLHFVDLSTNRREDMVLRFNVPARYTRGVAECLHGASKVPLELDLIRLRDYDRARGNDPQHRIDLTTGDPG